MNVLSLFDGISCGRIALDRANIPVTSYYASEIDKYAIKVSEKNYPEIIRLGDVTMWRDWDLPGIDLLLAGSPCQGFSFAGKQLAFGDTRSALFFEFVDILKTTKPKYFLLENVRMKKEYQNVITQYLGVEPIQINSALVSAQNRKRLYWTNIPSVTQPEDKGILLKDVLEYGENEVSQRGRGNNPGGLRESKSPSMGSSSWEQNVLVPVIKNRGELKERPDKSMCLDANYFKGADNHGQRTMTLKESSAGRIVGRRIKDGKRADNDKSIKPMQRVEINKDPQKTNTLSTVQKDNVIIEKRKPIQVNPAKEALKGVEREPYQQNRVYDENGISPALTQSFAHRTKVLVHNVYGGFGENKASVFEEKSATLTTSSGGGRVPSVFDGTGKEAKEMPLPELRAHIRKLTPIECERLQTLPDNYTEGAPKTQRYKMLGNGWTVDVIAHILKPLKEKEGEE